MQKEESMTEVPYKEAVDSLMYAMIATRPNLAFPISMASQYMARPGSKHWTVVKRIMGYLKRTLDVKLCFGGANIVFTRYCEADYVGNTND